MKDLFKKFAKLFGKVLLIVMYPIFIVIIIVLSVLLFQQTKNNKDALKEYRSIYKSADIPASEKSKVKDGIKDIGVFISELKSEIQSQNTEIDNLKKQTEADKKEGYGEIRGSILSFVASDGGLNLYQRVCAELKENANLQYCLTVSSIKKDFSLLVPAGEYYVYAEVIGSTEFANTKAYYTEFVKCTQDGGVQCSESLSDKKVLISVTSGSVKDDVDPQNWKFTK
jgi:hypothetical protein